MQQYLATLAYIRNIGSKREDRTGTGTLSHFGHVMHFNLTYGFPLLTTKKMHFKSIVHELIWFLSGSTNIQYLKDKTNIGYVQACSLDNGWELGYHIAKNYTGHGYATEAVMRFCQLLCQY